MIVHRLWITRKYDGYILKKVTQYSGWFLFGFIPLIIKTKKVDYYN